MRLLAALLPADTYAKALISESICTLQAKLFVSGTKDTAKDNPAYRLIHDEANLWTWAYAKVLLTPEERTAHYIEFVTDDLLTTNAAASATAFGQYRAMGVMTGNEVRAALNKAPLPDGNSLSNSNITLVTCTGSNQALVKIPRQRTLRHQCRQSSHQKFLHAMLLRLVKD